MTVVPGIPGKTTVCIKYALHQPQSFIPRDYLQITILDILDTPCQLKLHEDEHILEVEVKDSVLRIPHIIDEIPITEIETECGKNCQTEIKCIIFPKGLKSIKDEVFRNHPSLETVIIQDGIGGYGDLVFSECKELKHMVIGYGRVFQGKIVSALTNSRIKDLTLSSPELTFYLPNELIDRGYDKETFQHVIPLDDIRENLLKQYEPIDVGSESYVTLANQTISSQK